MTVPPSATFALRIGQILPEGQTLTVPLKMAEDGLLMNAPGGNVLLSVKMETRSMTLQESFFVRVGLSYGTEVNANHLADLNDMGLDVVDVIESVDAVLLGLINTSMVESLAQLDDVVMVERYGEIHLYGDIQTPAVKARNSSLYPGAWDLGVTGDGVVIAMVDTGVDNEHPGLNESLSLGMMLYAIAKTHDV